jgi:hypothetical protein
MKKRETQKTALDAWTVGQAMALNKMLDLVHDLIYIVKDEHLQARYERRFQRILDAMFPERAKRIDEAAERIRKQKEFENENK